MSICAFLFGCCNDQRCKDMVLNALPFEGADIDSILFTSRASFDAKGYDSLVFRDKKNKIHVFKFYYKYEYEAARPYCGGVGVGCLRTTNLIFFNATAISNSDFKIKSISIQNSSNSPKNNFEKTNSFDIKYQTTPTSIDTNRTSSFDRFSSLYSDNKYTRSTFIKSSTLINNKIYEGIKDTIGLKYSNLKEIFYIKNFIPAYIYFKDDTLYNANL